MTTLTKSTTESCPQPDDSIPHPNILFKIYFNITFRLHTYHLCDQVPRYVIFSANARW
jgi:hypothetical protein